MNNLKRILIFLISWSIIWYLVYLLTSWIQIIDWTDILNYSVYAVLILIFLYYIFFYSIRPTYIKRNKIINTVLWLCVIYVSQLLLNSWYDGIYYWDIFSVIWVVLTIIWPTNLLISKKIQKDSEYKNAEIIEIE